MLAIVAWAMGGELPTPVGACDAPVSTIGPLLGDPKVSNAELAAALTAPACRPAAGGTPSVEFAPIAEIPDATNASASWSLEHPLVVDARTQVYNLSRWPMPGVDASDRATAEQLLRLDRQEFPSRRLVVLVVSADGRAADTDGWLGSLAKAGYRSVALATLPASASWAPTPAPSSAPLPSGAVRAPERVVVNEQGDFTVRFPDSLGIPPLDVPLTDIQGFERVCQGGTCELLLLTSDVRVLVLRATEYPADDLRRRWIFGFPVQEYRGPSLRSLRAPTTEGTFKVVPVWTWADNARHTTHDAKHLIALRGNLLIRPCWMKVYRAWRSLPFMYRDPRGTLGLHVSIQGDGRVSGVEITSSDIRNPRVQTCAITGISAMRLPRSTDGQPYQIDTRYNFGVD